MPTQKEELRLNTQQDMSSEDMYVLQELFTEYVSLYRLELNSGKYEILRLIANTNAKQIVGEEYRIFADYDEFTRRYAETFIPETEQEEFLDWHKCENLKKRLQEKERLTYYYHSVSIFTYFWGIGTWTVFCIKKKQFRNNYRGHWMKRN